MYSKVPANSPGRNSEALILAKVSKYFFRTGDFRESLLLFLPFVFVLLQAATKNNISDVLLPTFNSLFRL